MTLTASRTVAGDLQVECDFMFLSNRVHFDRESQSMAAVHCEGCKG